MADIDFDTLLKRYSKKVFTLAYRITGNRQDAEDITQETFLQVHRGLAKFRGESAVYTWIYRIAVNTALRVKRRLDRTYLDSLDEKIEQFKHDIPDEVREWERDPEQRYLYEELQEEIRRACYHFMTFRLTDEQRIVYILRVTLDFTLDEISAILQIDKNTVKARLQRAKTNLGSYFSGRCQWLGGDSQCSCASRIGFALAFAPDILRRLKNLPPDEATTRTVGSALRQIEDIDEIYRTLPLEPFQTEALERYLKGA